MNCLHDKWMTGFTALYVVSGISGAFIAGTIAVTEETISWIEIGGVCCSVALLFVSLWGVFRFGFTEVGREDFVQIMTYFGITNVQDDEAEIVLVEDENNPKTSCVTSVRHFGGLVMSIMTGMILSFVLLYMLPLGFEMTRDRFSAKYDVFMIMVGAPIMEMLLSNVVYSRERKVYHFASAIGAFVSLNACSCGQYDWYLMMDMSSHEAELLMPSVFSVTFFVGAFLRWVSYVILFVALVSFYNTVRNQPERHNYLWIAFCGSLSIISGTVMIIMIWLIAEESEFSYTWMNSMLPYLMTTLFSMQVVFLPFVIAWKGVYFVSVVLTFQFIVYEFWDAVCTAYAVPVYIIGITLVLMFQWTYWKKKKPKNQESVIPHKDSLHDSESAVELVFVHDDIVDEDFKENKIE